ncbi:MAG: DUF167 domain-containing protein [Syntrophomonadaceae bacterium]|nr:DUF167 domain-containing protein [Syntrophomonadaceae bacterium]MDD3888986.1 DUF167 domain-containing protein [Syntrophomonadaceae bacterium]MDD4549723.1 DUF167 domain-containing protein [Syntrophomonadaceae bacterium]
MLNVKEQGNNIVLEVKVQPRSSRNQIVGEQEGALKVKLTAPPVDGEANQALINFLARLLGIPKRDIIILKGETSRHKYIELKNINYQSFLKKTGLS